MQPFPISHPVAFKAVVLIGVIVPFLATILALYFLWERAVSWSDLALLAIMYSLIKLGEEAGIHRMLSHRSFQPHPVVKFVLLVLGSMALEGPHHRPGQPQLRVLGDALTRAPLSDWWVDRSPVGWPGADFPGAPCHL